MGFGRFREREHVLHPEPELAVPDPSEQLAGARLQLLARRRVLVEGRTREIERAFLAEDLRIERRDGAARLPEQDHHPARRQTIEPFVEGAPADRIVDDLDALAA